MRAGHPQTWNRSLVFVSFIMAFIVILRSLRPFHSMMQGAPQPPGLQPPADLDQGTTQLAGENTVIIVMPSPHIVSGPMGRIDRMRAINETWGSDFVRDDKMVPFQGNRRRNRLVFVLDDSDSSAAEAVDLWGARDSIKRGISYLSRSTSSVLVVPAQVSDGGNDGDARMRYVLGQVAMSHNPDFVFLCNEHTFVIAENLRCFVKDLDPEEPVYLGNRFRREQSQGEAMLNSGAAGFILSKGSLHLLLAAWGQRELGALSNRRDGLVLTQGHEQASKDGGSLGAVESTVNPECMAKSRFERENPGVTLARCLKVVGVEAQDTTDIEGGQRFNAYGPVRLAQGKIDSWYKKVHSSVPGLWLAGPACCSKDTVSFHYVAHAEARVMHKILHDRKRYLARGYDEAYRIWPSTREDLGGYASAPTRGDSTFDLLLRKITLCQRRST